MDTQKDLDAGIVTTTADADRIGEALQLWPQVLMQDPRVQEAYATWHLRHRGAVAESVRLMHVLTARWPPRAADLERPGVDRLMADMRLLKTLVTNLGLSDQAWLPKMLWFEFGRQAMTPDQALDVSLPPDTVWPINGRAPKHGALHHEDLQRNLTWLYRATVKTPHDAPNALAGEYIKTKAREGVHISNARNTVKNGIRRAQQFLRCVNHG